MPALRTSLVAAAAVATVVILNGSIAHAQVVCGGNVTEKVVMEEDLNCINNPGFTIAGGGSVDMAGYQVTACSGCTGIALAGQGAKLSNGSVVGSGAGSIGVLLGGSGVHQVENVTVVGSEVGFSITSDKCKLANCTALSNSEYGFISVGDKTAISRSHASVDATGQGFFLTTDNSNLTENTARGEAGFVVVGSANKLSRNSATDCDACLSVTGNGNKLSGNTATRCAVSGVFISGNENKLSKTVSFAHVGHGIEVLGNENKLSKNSSSDNTGNGIRIAGVGNNVNGSNSNNNNDNGIEIDGGTANSLKSNVTMGNGDNGVLATNGATSASISKTAALENGNNDLQDDSMNCGGNVWSKNVFRTSEAGGVADHVCIQ